MMYPWVFNVYMELWCGLGKGLELLHAKGGRFEINLFFLQMIQH